jgi:hypothetical protein
MANEIRGIRAAIEFVLKKSGLVEAKAGINDLVAVGKRAESAFQRFGAAIKGVFAAAAAAAGLQQLSRLVVDAVKSFAGLERTLGVVALQMRRLGVDVDQATPRVRSFLEALERTGGATLEQTLPAFQKFLTMTKDVEAALYLVSLANDAAESTTVEWTAAVDAVANLYQGRVKSALTTFGLEAIKADGAVRTGAEGLQELERMLSGTGTTLDDTANQLDIANASWAEFARNIGELAAPAVRLLNQTLMATLAWLEAISAWRKGDIGIGQLDETVAASLLRRMQEQADGPQVSGAGRQTALRGAGKSQIERQINDIERAATRALDAERDALADYLDDYYDAQKAKEAASVAAEQARVDAVTAAHEEERAQLARTEEIRQDIREMSLSLLQEGTQQWIDESLRMEEMRYQKEVALAKDNLEQIAELRRRHELRVAQIKGRGAAYEAALSGDVAARKIADMEAIAQATTAYLSAAFSESKTAALAQVAIDLALAIMRIWAKHGDNVYVAAALTALVSATAHAQIQRIRKASYGGSGASYSGTGNTTRGRGFDDPVNDRLVYEGSRRWARDQVRLMQMGFGDVWRDMAGGTPTSTSTTTNIDNQSHVTVNMNGRIIRAERDLRDLHRDLRRVGRRDDQARFIR